MKKFILIFAISIFFSFFLPLFAIADFLSGLKYRKPITINNTSNSNNLTDYQVLITLDTQSLISSWKMRSDCGDIRFTDSNGTNLLNYWIESGTNTTSTKIWVKIPSIPANSTKTIYVYYGNPSATSQSNGDAVFLFFDDFPGTSLNTTKWPTKSGTITVNNGIATISAGSYIAASNFDFRNYNAAAFEGKVATQYASGMVANFGVVSSNNFGMNYLQSPRGFNHCWYTGGAIWAESYNDSSGNEYSYGTYTTSWNRISLKWISGTSVVFNSEGNTYTKTDYIPTQSASAAMNPHINSYSGGAIYLDFVFARKYTSPEPTTSVGTEEYIYSPLLFLLFE